MTAAAAEAAAAGGAEPSEMPQLYVMAERRVARS
jgi:hypothetical protein